MAQESTETRYSITIKDIASSNAEGSVALALSQIAKNMTLGQILKRLESLPWILTKKATHKTALKVAQVLEKAGATVIIEPPLVGVPSPPKPVTATSMSQTTPVNYTSTNMPPSLMPNGSNAYMRKRGEPMTEGGVVPIEPLSIGGILDRTFQICKEHFWPLVGILAFPWLVLIVISVVMSLIFLLGLASGLTTGKDMPAVATIVILVVAFIVAMIVAFVLFYIAQGAVIYAVSQVYLGREIGVKESYQFMWPRAVKFILTSMLFGFVLIGMFISLFVVATILFALFKATTGSGFWSAIFWIPLLLIPGYAIPKLLLFDKVIVLEDLAYGEALKRSWNLVSGQGEGNWPRHYWVKLVVLLHVLFFIYMAISAVFSIPSLVIKIAMPKSLVIIRILIEAILSNVGSLLTGIFGTVCFVVFYYDIRNRKEGFDLQLAMESQESPYPRT